MKIPLGDAVLFLPTFNRRIHFVSFLHNVIIGNVHLTSTAERDEVILPAYSFFSILLLMVPIIVGMGAHHTLLVYPDFMDK